MVTNKNTDTAAFPAEYQALLGRQRNGIARAPENQSPDRFSPS